MVTDLEFHEFLFYNPLLPVISIYNSMDLWLNRSPGAVLLRRRKRQEASEVVHQPEELLKVGDSEEFRVYKSSRSHHREIWHRRCWTSSQV
ncbi:hypothetical protein TIFTF001_047783 [Ficus carica]|uniref:Uncharacterized protein n=1 Tax=Ficus carica TaxID=3494 RepID=A0AA87Z526_FICCA|nr:hypothetical protein TIFTF001_047731 [Ficus carica]GMN25548.1 hypothetical protein TIFTF001_047732 [Ficus carica]GMN25949.1 hypothetical protein TIFTF001_047767 [Ficus carica]GMN26136.1 hypothetical protein TIFTF001_047783 [Ficus carica]